MATKKQTKTNKHTEAAGKRAGSARPTIQEAAKYVIATHGKVLKELEQH